MPRTSYRNEYERRLLGAVSSVGWHCTNVVPNEGDTETPPFSYSIGLFHSYGHPEILVFGLHPETATGVIGNIATIAVWHAGHAGFR